MIIEILKKIITVIKYIIIAIIFFFVAIVVVQKFSDNMSVAGYRVFMVVTESMVPKYKVGDVLLVKETDPEKIKKQDDVTYMGKVGSFKDKVVTHQVIGIEDAGDGTLNFTTKGIANDKEDPLVNESQIYGVVQTKLTLITKIKGIVNNMYGMYFLIIIPFAIIVFNEIKSFKEDKESKEDDEDDENDDSEEEDINKRMKKRKERRAKRRRKYE